MGVCRDMAATEERVVDNINQRVGCGGAGSLPFCVMDSGYEAVQLEPFLHQVGGHSSVLCFDEHTLCKPLVSREHHFYKTMPDEMKEFTPEYRGVVEVMFRESSDGYLSLMAYPIGENGCRKAAPYAGNSPSSGGDTAHSDSDSETENIGHKQRIRIKRSGSIEHLEVESQAKMIFELVNPLNEDEDSQTTAQNPWSLQCHRKQIDKMKQMRTDSGAHKFILLENLASHFEYPCILDLKMGTRQHGDEASEEKRRGHMLKCERSTSRTLGARICGMQVYQPPAGSFLCHDKYYGRQLTDEGFHRTLHQFLHDGRRLRAELLEPIISRLEQLHNTLSNQETFRFYSSSLLVMYEGAAPVDNERPPRAAASPPQAAESPASSVSTQGYSEHYGSGPTPHIQVRPTSPAQSPTSPGVDIRMIDFAHATHKLDKGFYRDDIVHLGPDKGYLFGLESLISAFRRLKHRASVQ